MEKKEHIISILVHNKPDVLARIAGTLGGKGYNIESLSVNATTQYEISKIVLTTVGTQETVNRIEGQLQRLVDVIQVDDLTNVESIHRELILVRLNLTADKKEQIKKAVDTNKWKVIVSADTYIILEITGVEFGKLIKVLSHVASHAGNSTYQLRCAYSDPIVPFRVFRLFAFVIGVSLNYRGLLWQKLILAALWKTSLQRKNFR